MATKGKLYLVAGASGAGKSTVMSAVAAIAPNCVLVKKATTRSIRSGDPNEDSYPQPGLANLKGNKRLLIYATNGSMLYGVNVDEIRAIINSGKNALLVVVHTGARQQLEEMLGRDSVVEIFIHRDLTPSMREVLLARGGLRRLVVRERIYESLATGQYIPDYIILNNQVKSAVEQFLRIMQASGLSPRRDLAEAKGVLHIVVAATGVLRDVVQSAPFAIPGWGKAYCEKDTPTPEEVKANPLATGWMEHSLFGRCYRLNPNAVVATLRELGVAFIMFSDIASARQLQKIVEHAGFAAPMHYLHQDQLQVDDSVQDFPECEWEARLAHAQELQELYEQELILEAHPILLVNGMEGALDWVYRQINERPRRLQEK
jgi:guanylate kinase